MDHARCRSRWTSRRSRPTPCPGRRRRLHRRSCPSARRPRRPWARWRRGRSRAAPWWRCPRCSGAAVRPPGPGSPWPPRSASRGWGDSSPTNPRRSRPTSAPTRRRAPSGSRASLRGPGFGGEGRIAVNGLLFGLGLLEGQLKPSGAAATAPQLDLVQGTLFVGGRLAPWLEMTVGPVVRAYVADSTTERWVYWQARARVDAPIVMGKLGSYFEVWRGRALAPDLPTAAGRVPWGG